MKNTSNVEDVVSWVFVIVFLTIGILNMILAHPLPGLIYILISCIFYPPVNIWLKRKLGFSFYFTLKLILFILIMWPTLGVGDLAEILGL